MPIDPRIPLMGTPPPQFDMLGSLGRIAQIKRMEAISQQEQQEMALRQQAAREDEQFKQVMAESPDLETALPKLRKINPERAMKFEQLYGSIQKTSAETSAFTRAQKEDAQFQAVMAESGGELTDAVMSRLKAINLKRALEFKKLALEAEGPQGTFSPVTLASGEIGAFGSRTGAITPTGQQGPPRTVSGGSDYAQFLTSFAKERGKTPDTLTVAENLQARKVFGQADDRPTGGGGEGGGAKPGDAQLVQAILKNPGLYAGITPTTKERLIGPLMAAGFTGFAAGQTGKPPTGAQNRALNFFNRAKQAADEIETVAGEVAGMGVAGQYRLKYAPNIAQSQTGQTYDAAQRAFTEARLRKDSGAAIPEHEFENDRRTYFVQPGDTPKTIEQKARARAAVLASIAYEAGPALSGFYGDDAEGMLQAFKDSQKIGGATTQNAEAGVERWERGPDGKPRKVNK